jgi:hypothetical protein
MLYLDGVYVEDNKYGSGMRFQWIKAPTNEELSQSKGDGGILN